MDAQRVSENLVDLSCDPFLVNQPPTVRITTDGCVHEYVCCFFSPFGSHFDKCNAIFGSHMELDIPSHWFVFHIESLHLSISKKVSVKNRKPSFLGNFSERFQFQYLSIKKFCYAVSQHSCWFVVVNCSFSMTCYKEKYVRITTHSSSSERIQ